MSALRGNGGPKGRPIPSLFTVKLHYLASLVGFSSTDFPPSDHWHSEFFSEFLRMGLFGSS